MAKLYYRYGTMDSSKSSRLLMDAYEYKQRGEYPFLMKSVLDSRSAKGKIVSRVGLEADCLDIDKDKDLYNMFLNMDDKPAIILVDEAQFLTHIQVVHLRLIVDVLNIPVMCYGLKTNFLGNLFEGSQSLFSHANRFEEIKTICRESGCKKKAMYNGRFKNGKPVFQGETVVAGDTENNSKDKDSYYYIPKCSVHFFADFARYNKESGNIE